MYGLIKRKKKIKWQCGRGEYDDDGDDTEKEKEEEDDEPMIVTRARDTETTITTTTIRQESHGNSQHKIFPSYLQFKMNWGITHSRWRKGINEIKKKKKKKDDSDEEADEDRAKKQFVRFAFFLIHVTKYNRDNNNSGIRYGIPIVTLFTMYSKWRLMNGNTDTTIITITDTTIITTIKKKGRNSNRIIHNYRTDVGI